MFDPLTGQISFSFFPVLLVPRMLIALYNAAAASCVVATLLCGYNAADRANWGARVHSLLLCCCTAIVATAGRERARCLFVSLGTLNVLTPAAGVVESGRHSAVECVNLQVAGVASWCKMACTGSTANVSVIGCYSASLQTDRAAHQRSL